MMNCARTAGVALNSLYMPHQHRHRPRSQPLIRTTALYQPIAHGGRKRRIQKEDGAAVGSGDVSQGSSQTASRVMRKQVNKQVNMPETDHGPERHPPQSIERKVRVRAEGYFSIESSCVIKQSCVHAVSVYEVPRAVPRPHRRLCLDRWPPPAAGLRYLYNAFFSLLLQKSNEKDKRCCFSAPIAHAQSSVYRLPQSALCSCLVFAFASRSTGIMPAAMTVVWCMMGVVDRVKRDLVLPWRM